MAGGETTTDPRKAALDSIKENDSAWNSISSSYRNDNNFILDAMKVNHNIWNHLPMDKKLVKDITIAGVSTNGHRLFEVANTYKDTTDVCQAACRNNGAALAYVSDRLKDDMDTVKIACTQLYEAATYMSDRIKDTKSLVIELLAINGRILKFINRELKKDREVCNKAVDNTGAAYSYCDPSVQEIDRNLAIKAVKSYPVILGGIHKAWKLDPEIMYLAAKHSTTEAVNAANIPFRVEKLIG